MPIVLAEDGVRIACREAGPPGGPAVLLIPDWLASARFYEECLPRLAERVPVVAYDPRGTGRSDRPETGYGLAREAADAAVVAEALRARPVWVVGHGYGALVALRLAQEAPDLVAGLFLVAPPLGAAEGVDAWAASLEDPRRLYEQLAGARARPVATARLMAAAQDMAHTTWEAGRSQLEHARSAAATFDTWLARLEAPDLPVDVLAGEYDPLASPGAVRRAAWAAWPRFRLTVLPETGHYPVWETADDFVDLLLEAYAKPPEARPPEEPETEGVPAAAEGPVEPSEAATDPESP
ncbi:MAG: alpha/beta hydrolase [Actinomycetia bacterium]|nr:alpha/beta hydrolase [Actinomycetes bacterium]